MKHGLKKFILTACACLLWGGVLIAQTMPAFDKPNSLVYDTENGKEDKFAYLITATDYAHDGKVVAEIWGYGGKEKEEWKSLGEITLLGFSDSLRLNYDANKYIRYRYIAIQLKAGKRKFHITADQKKKNMNFYFWELGDDISSNPLPYNKEHPDAFGFDINTVDKNIGGNVRIINEAECSDGLECTMYAYSIKDHSWEVFGDCHATPGEMTWINKKKLGYSLKTFRYYAIEVFSSDGEQDTPDFSVYMDKNIGGLYITIKDKQVDNSATDEMEELKRQLEELKKQLNKQ